MPTARLKKAKGLVFLSGDCIWFCSMNIPPEVHADAATALKVMDTLSDDPGPKQVVAMYKLLFPDESRKAIDKMHLNFQDFKTVVKGAITLITGEDGEEPGEAATHTTT